MDDSSDVSSVELIDNSTSEIVDPCRRQLEFSTGSSSGLGSSIETSKDSEQSFPSSTASILNKDIGTDAVSATDDSDTSDDESDGPVATVVDAIVNYFNAPPVELDRTQASQASSIVAPVVPASTSMLQPSDVSIGE